jgi:uncharacterized protein YjiS (DUF1127 family)
MRADKTSLDGEVFPISNTRRRYMYAETNRQVTTHALSSTANYASVANIASKRRNVAANTGKVAAPKGSSGVIAYLIRLWTDWRARRDLEQLPDEVLSDIGLSRADIVRETMQPFWAPLDYDTLETQRRRSAIKKPYRYY